VNKLIEVIGTEIILIDFYIIHCLGDNLIKTFINNFKKEYFTIVLKNKRKFLIK